MPLGLLLRSRRSPGSWRGEDVGVGTVRRGEPPWSASPWSERWNGANGRSHWHERLRTTLPGRTHCLVSRDGAITFNRWTADWRVHFRRRVLVVWDGRLRTDRGHSVATSLTADRKWPSSSSCQWERPLVPSQRFDQVDAERWCSLRRARSLRFRRWTTSDRRPVVLRRSCQWERPLAPSQHSDQGDADHGGSPRRTVPTPTSSPRREPGERQVADAVSTASRHYEVICGEPTQLVPLFKLSLQML